MTFDRVVFVDADELVADRVPIADKLESLSDLILDDGGTGLMILYAQVLEDRIRVARTLQRSTDPVLRARMCN